MGMENYVIFSVMYVCENTTTMETRKTLHFPGQTAAKQEEIKSKAHKVECIALSSKKKHNMHRISIKHKYNNRSGKLATD